MSDQFLPFKYIIIGCSGVGKTSILRRLIENKFNKGGQSTVGIEYHTKIVNVNGRAVKMMIWDTAGQERFYTIAKAYFRMAHGVILVFDITDRKSFEKLPNWLRDAKAEADPNCTAILVGNKSDLQESRTVTVEEAERFANKHELTYIETSASSGENIIETFTRIAESLIQKVDSNQIKTATAPNIHPPKETTSSNESSSYSRCCK